MTDTIASMPPQPDDMHSRLDPSEQPERPGTIPWQLLGANDYRSTIEDLGSWLAWLVPVYRIPPSVIPPCWFLHTGLIEELGHLWTGWRVTRHPESGLGMVGLEWDNHRERVTSRLRELVAIAGCNGTTHSAKPGPILNRDNTLWETALQNETTARTDRSAERAVRSAALGVLLKAEQRNELALDILRDIAADPGHPTAIEMSQAAVALQNMTRTAGPDAQRRSREALTHFGGVRHDAHLNVELTAARAGLLVRIADGCAADRIDEPMRRWIDSVDSIMPVEDTILRAAARIIGQAGAASSLSSCKARHSGASFLLTTSTAQDQNPPVSDET